jgi:hypothetical protein
MLPVVPHVHLIPGIMSLKPNGGFMSRRRSGHRNRYGARRTGGSKSVHKYHASRGGIRL